MFESREGEAIREELRRQAEKDLVSAALETHAKQLEEAQPNFRQLAENLRNLPGKEYLAAHLVPEQDEQDPKLTLWKLKVGFKGGREIPPKEVLNQWHETGFKEFTLDNPTTAQVLNELRKGNPQGIGDFEDSERPFRKEETK